MSGPDSCKERHPHLLAAVGLPATEHPMDIRATAPRHRQRTLIGQEVTRALGKLPGDNLAKKHTHSVMAKQITRRRIATAKPVAHARQRAIRPPGREEVKTMNAAQTHMTEITHMRSSNRGVVRK